jgi:hypothetical protein
MLFSAPKKPYKPLNEQIGLLTIESCFFSHKGVNYEILATNVKPHIHTIKNCDSGNTSDMLHSKLLALAES